jgi:hypothetical protein
MKRLSVLALLGVFFCSAVQAENWPAGRGASGQGHCTEKNLPLRWGSQQGVKWKIKLDHQTKSSLASSNGEIFIRTFKHLWCINGKND